MPRLAARSVSTRTSTCGCVSRKSESSRVRPGFSRGRCNDDVAPARELVVVRPAEHELHRRSATTAATAAAAAAVVHERRDADVGDVFPLLAEDIDQRPASQLCARPTASASRSRCPTGCSSPARSRRRARSCRRRSTASSRTSILSAASSQARVARTLGRLDRAVELTAVFLRRIFLRQRLHEEIGANADRNAHDDGRPRRRAANW